MWLLLLFEHLRSKHCLLWHHINSGTPDVHTKKLQLCGFIAQWLEHWSCKPGVVSSILTGPCALSCVVFYGNHQVKNCALFQPLRLVGSKSSLLLNHINSGTPDFSSLKLQHCGFIAQLLEHWSCKPGVV